MIAPDPALAGLRPCRRRAPRRVRRRVSPRRGSGGRRGLRDGAGRKAAAEAEGKADGGRADGRESRPGRRRGAAPGACSRGGAGACGGGSGGPAAALPGLPAVGVAAVAGARPCAVAMPEKPKVAAGDCPALPEAEPAVAGAGSSERGRSAAARGQGFERSARDVRCACRLRPFSRSRRCRSRWLQAVVEARQAAKAAEPDAERDAEARRGAALRRRLRLPPRRRPRRLRPPPTAPAGGVGGGTRHRRSCASGRSAGLAARAGAWRRRSGRKRPRRWRGRWQPQAVIGQVAVAIGRTSDRRVEIRLDPPELGRVQIHLTPVDGGVQAMVLADRPETQDLLRRHAEALARELGEAGYGNVEPRLRRRRRGAARAATAPRTSELGAGSGRRRPRAEAAPAPAAPRRAPPAGSTSASDLQGDPTWRSPQTTSAATSRGRGKPPRQRGDDATAAITGDFETFLTLLTTQMRNQDPLKPMDSTEFVAQLASFSAVEQQIRANDRLQGILDVLSGGSPAGLARVDRPRGAGRRQGRLRRRAGRGRRDAGRRRRQGGAGGEERLRPGGGAAAGGGRRRRAVSWDGTDAMGATVADGRYGFSAGELPGRRRSSAASRARSSPRCSEVRIVDGVPVLVVDDGTQVPLDEVGGGSLRPAGRRLSRGNGRPPAGAAISAAGWRRRSVRSHAGRRPGRGGGRGCRRHGRRRSRCSRRHGCRRRRPAGSSARRFARSSAARRSPPRSPSCRATRVEVDRAIGDAETGEELPAAPSRTRTIRGRTCTTGRSGSATAASNQASPSAVGSRPVASRRGRARGTADPVAGGRDGDRELGLGHLLGDVGEERCREVALAGVGHHEEDGAAGGQRLGDRLRGDERGARREAAEDALAPGEVAGGGERPGAAYPDHPVDVAGVEGALRQLRDEVRGPALHQVGAEHRVRGGGAAVVAHRLGDAAGEDRRVVRFGDDHLHLRPLGLQHAGDAVQGAAGAGAGDEGVEAAALEGGEDLARGGAGVGVGVGPAASAAGRPGLAALRAPAGAAGGSEPRHAAGDLGREAGAGLLSRDDRADRRDGGRADGGAGGDRTAAGHDRALHERPRGDARGPWPDLQGGALLRGAGVGADDLLVAGTGAARGGVGGAGRARRHSPDAARGGGAARAGGDAGQVALAAADRGGGAGRPQALRALRVFRRAGDAGAAASRASMYFDGAGSSPSTTTTGPGSSTTCGGPVGVRTTSGTIRGTGRSGPS